LTNHKNEIIIFGIIFLVLCPILSVYAADAPFSIKITPKEAKVKVGDSVKYECTIEASPGFDDPIHFEITVKALSYEVTHQVGTIDPPYPQDFSYTLVIPKEVPLAVTGTATIKGTSGEHVVEETVKLTIEKPFEIPGFPVESIIIGLITGALILLMFQRRQ
jgi:hypothetical protein